MSRPVDAGDAARRPLPAGYADEHSPQFVPRPIRSYYFTVTCVSDDHDAIVDAACDWIEADMRRRREASS